MPIILPNGLPAADLVRRDRHTVLDGRVTVSAVRPLEVLLVNLMPDKQRAEAQFARVLAAARWPVRLTLTVPVCHVWRHTDAAHLGRFYLPWPAARRFSYDGLIVTGAPVETLPFAQVDYWPEMRDMLDWAEDQRVRSLFICWAAQAALYRRHLVPKHMLPAKRFGVYRHAISTGSGLLRGLSAGLLTPVSRHTEVRAGDLPPGRGLSVTAASPDSGLCLVEEPARRSAYMFNHPEYDPTALADEYRRDLNAGKPIAVPANYFPDDDPTRTPTFSWREHGLRFYANWVEQLAADRMARMHGRAA